MITGRALIDYAGKIAVRDAASEAGQRDEIKFERHIPRAVYSSRIRGQEAAVIAAAVGRNLLML